MKRVADGVWQICTLPPNAINAYLIEHETGDVLIDAGTRWDRRRFMKALTGRCLSLVALTHVHPDHQGVAKAVCESFNVPLACHERDRDIMEGCAAMRPSSWQIRWSHKLFTGPRHPVSRVLKEDDDVAGFRVVESPGHTLGHVSFFRKSDGVLIVGDAMANMSFVTLRQKLREPPRFFSCDPAENRRSIRKLAGLRPRLCLFGHGPPLRQLEMLDNFLSKLSTMT